MHERKATYDRVAAFVQPGAYVAMRLCGLNASQAFIDTTYLHFSGFADNRRCRWDSGLCRTLGLDERKLPAIVTPDTVVGTTIAPSARPCGLRPGVPVVAGCGDTAASFLACGATREGICVDVAGTASVFAATTQRFGADTKHRTLGCGQSAVAGLWHPYAYVNGGGMNLEWFRTQVANRGNNRGRHLLTFDQLEKMAAAVPVKEGLPLFIPHLGGQVCPSRPDLRGAWVGLTWEHTVGHLYRGVLEGVALEYAAYKRVLHELYRDLQARELRVTGGGSTSALWNRIKADALQTPVRRVARNEGAPLGAAMLAGVGVGMFRSLPGTARRWVALEKKQTRPRPSMAGCYATRIRRYETALRRLDKV
jgi:xylulokinase